MINLKSSIKKFPILTSFVRHFLNIARQIGSKSKWRSIENFEVIKLDLGSGAKRGINGWTTIDIKGADINWDLRRGIFLPDNCVEYLYSSHLMEHIPYVQLIAFLKECRRVLKPTGKLSVCVPNARLYLESYMSGKLFRDKSTWWQPAIVDTGSKIDQINYIAYMGGQHNNMFDEESLVNTLLAAGFQSASLRGFDPDLDLRERDFESIYAIAEK